MIALVVASLAWCEAAAHDSPAARVRAITVELEFDPDNASLWLERATLQQRLQHYDKALADVDRAAQLLGAAHPNVATRRGLLLLDAGKHAEAVAALDKVKPKDVTQRVAVARATAYVAMQRVGPAIKAYEQAWTFGVTPDIALSLGRAWERLGELNRSVLIYQRALAELGGAVVVKLALIDAYTRLHRIEKALGLIDAMIAKVPVKAAWRIRRAEVLLAARRNPEAAAAYRAALKEIERRYAKRPNQLLKAQRQKASAGLERALKSP